MDLDELIQNIPRCERVVIDADLNGHIGAGNRDYEEVMARFGIQERNTEREMVVDFAKRIEMDVVNTFFQNLYSENNCSQTFYKADKPCYIPICICNLTISMTFYRVSFSSKNSQRQGSNLKEECGMTG